MWLVVVLFDPHFSLYWLPEWLRNDLIRLQLRSFHRFLAPMVPYRPEMFHVLSSIERLCVIIVITLSEIPFVMVVCSTGLKVVVVVMGDEMIRLCSVVVVVMGVENTSAIDTTNNNNCRVKKIFVFDDDINILAANM